jgi:hypothetical protein
MKYVPEEKEMDAVKQLEILSQRLTGNSAFSACRGQLNITFSEYIQKLTAEAHSPTQLLKHWDKFISSTRVMANLLAQFKRDGLNLAHEELLHALIDPNFIISNEIWALEKTLPVTILMLDPERTIAMLNWIIGADVWGDRDKFIDWKDAQGPQPDNLTMDLFEKFSTLEKEVRDSQKIGADEGSDLLLALLDAQRSIFSQETLERVEIGKAYHLAAGQWSGYVYDIRQIKFLYMFMAEQSEVLSMFTREQQKTVASWQFRLPGSIDLDKLIVGIHPEEAHNLCQKRYPATCSKGLSHGLGSIILSSDQNISYKNICSSGQSKDSASAITFDVIK